MKAVTYYHCWLLWAAIAIYFVCSRDLDFMLYMANICCPIETEPKTLNQGQLNRAREVAADVVQKMEPNEASTIFNEKLIPSPQIKDQEREKEEKELHEPVEKGDIIEKPCQCLCTTAIVESPDQMSLKEPLSAPF